MEKIKNFESISTIKVIGVMTSVIFFISTLLTVFNIILGTGRYYSLILPVFLILFGFYMFVRPYRNNLRIGISVFIFYTIINVGLVVIIEGTDYMGQIILETMCLLYFVFRYIKIKDTEVTKDDIKDYNNSNIAYEKNGLFYLTVTDLLLTNRWVCTLYEDCILVRKRYKFNKKLIDKKEFKLDFNQTNSRILIGNVHYTGKKSMCRMKSSEYDEYKELIGKEYIR